MPIRIVPLVNDQIYHIYNRGVASQPIFSFKRDYERFLLLISYYRFVNTPIRLSKLLQIPKEERQQILTGLETERKMAVELVAFCLMPNHFHLLVQQKSDGGISKFLRQVIDAYTRYFNTKYQRAGPLFQGTFKAVRIGTDEQLLHVSRYIHLNPLTTYIINEEHLIEYSWSSLIDFINANTKLVNPEVVLSFFKSSNDYLKFVLDQADYAKELKRIKHLTFDA